MKIAKTGFEPRKVGYVRLAKSAPSLEEQRAALSAAGLGDRAPIYVDQTPRQKSKAANPVTLPQRAAMIDSLQPGDAIIITNAAIIGMSLADVMATVKEVGRAGCTIFDVAAQREIRWSPEADEVTEFYERVQVVRGKETSAKMTAARIAAGLPVGATPKVTQEQKALILKLWIDPASTMSAQDIADEAGVGRRTLYRLDLPERRSGKPSN